MCFPFNREVVTSFNSSRLLLTTTLLKTSSDAVLKSVRLPVRLLIRSLIALRSSNSKACSNLALRAWRYISPPAPSVALLICFLISFIARAVGRSLGLDNSLAVLYSSSMSSTVNLPRLPLAFFIASNWLAIASKAVTVLRRYWVSSRYFSKPLGSTGALVSPDSLAFSYISL